jgi:FMN phosphatase YigB (HAD superfamily)
LTIEAVTFDFWNTIGVEAPGSYRRRVITCVDLLGSAGYPVDLAAFETTFQALADVFVRSWRAGEQYTAEMGAHECARRLGLSLSPELLGGMAAAMGSADIDARTSPNIGPCLHLLKERGIRLGIICDTGFTNGRKVRSALSNFGLLDLFDHLTFSDEVGVYKPAPESFAHAMAGLNVDDPRTLAHVGENHRADVVGAMRAGWTAIRYAGVIDDPGEPDAHLVVTDHADLLAALGLS